MGRRKRDKPEEVVDWDVGQVSSVRRTKDEAVQDARGRTRVHEPSQGLVYKKNGDVQSERIYG